MNVINFIGKKYPQYGPEHWYNFGVPYPIEGEGYIDENGAQGKFTDPDRDIVYITFVNGVKNGKCETKSREDTREIFNYVDGKIKGWIERYNPQIGLHSLVYKVGNINLASLVANFDREGKKFISYKKRFAVGFELVFISKEEFDSLLKEYNIPPPTKP